MQQISQQVIKTKKTKLTKKSKGLKHERVKHHDKSTYRNFKREKEEIGV
tara:strand:- start:272 stop:418 length:147 start_codon:yes stop_codon:yes gene_type:complete